MENKRMIETIKILSHADTPMSGPELSRQLGITVRTLRNDLKEYKETLYQHGMEIISKHAIGYKLVI